MFTSCSLVSERIFSVCFIWKCYVKFHFSSQPQRSWVLFIASLNSLCLSSDGERLDGHHSSNSLFKKKKKSFVVTVPEWSHLLWRKLVAHGSKKKSAWTSIAAPQTSWRFSTALWRLCGRVIRSHLPSPKHTYWQGFRKSCKHFQGQFYDPGSSSTLHLYREPEVRLIRTRLISFLGIGNIWCEEWTHQAVAAVRVHVNTIGSDCCGEP